MDGDAICKEVGGSERISGEPQPGGKERERKGREEEPNEGGRIHHDHYIAMQRINWGMETWGKGMGWYGRTKAQSMRTNVEGQIM